MARARDTMPEAGQGAGHTAGTAMAAVDAHGVVVAWGREAERLSGLSATDVIGRCAGRLLADPEVILRAPAFTDRSRRGTVGPGQPGSAAPTAACWMCTCGSAPSPSGTVGCGGWSPRPR